MIEVQPKINVVKVVIEEFPRVALTITPSVQPVTVTPVFTVATGPAGAGAEVGPGLKLVGAEIRYDISSLTGG